MMQFLPHFFKSRNSKGVEPSEGFVEPLRVFLKGEYPLFKRLICSVIWFGDSSPPNYRHRMNSCKEFAGLLSQSFRSIASNLPLGQQVVHRFACQFLLNLVVDHFIPLHHRALCQNSSNRNPALAHFLHCPSFNGKYIVVPSFRNSQDK